MLNCKKIPVVLFLFAFFSADAQTGSLVSAKKDSLYYKFNFLYLRPRLVLDGKGIGRRDEKDIFNKVPASVPYYKKYKNRFMIGFVSACVTSLGLIFMEIPEKQAAKNITRFSTLALFINSEIFLVSGLRNLKKAIRIRNREVLKY